MPERWSSSGLDLLLPIDRTRGLRTGLERALRDAVRAGRLAPGAPLPSSRALARDLGVARGTVSQAYEQLVAEGFLTARQRSGVRVAPQAASRTPPTHAEPFPPGQLYRPPVPGIDLLPGRPDLSSFPRGQWLAATRQVLQSVPNAAFGRADQAGCEELREALAGYLGRARGVVTDPDRVIVCAGFSHGLRLVCQALRRSGAETVAVEDPFEPDFRTVVEQAGLRPVAVAVDDDGLAVGELAGEAAAAVTPAHQYPLGVTMSPERRTRLLAWARESGAYVLEDDYDGEFRYDRQPIGALQGLAPDRVVYLGTTSKTIAPGLRIGWLVVPAELVRPVHEVMRGEAAHVGVVDQLVLARLVDTGELDRHLRHCRSRYRRRRDRLADAVRDLPGVRLSGIAAGLHAVLELPGGSDAEAGLLAHLAAHSITVEGLSRFYLRPETAPLGIVVGYATPPEHGYNVAVDRLVRVLHAYLRDTQTAPGTISGTGRDQG